MFVATGEPFLGPTINSQKVQMIQTVHEFKQFVDDSFQEPPMCSQEPRILPDNVHDV